MMQKIRYTHTHTQTHAFMCALLAQERGCRLRIPRRALVCLGRDQAFRDSFQSLSCVCPIFHCHRHVSLCARVRGHVFLQFLKSIHTCMPYVRYAYIRVCRMCDMHTYMYAICVICIHTCMPYVRYAYIRVCCMCDMCVALTALSAACLDSFKHTRMNITCMSICCNNVIDTQYSTEYVCWSYVKNMLITHTDDTHTHKHMIMRNIHTWHTYRSYIPIIHTCTTQITRCACTLRHAFSTHAHAHAHAHMHICTCTCTHAHGTRTCVCHASPPVRLGRLLRLLEKIQKIHQQYTKHAHAI